MRSARAKYQRVASWYDGLGELYSGGAIRRAKLAHLEWVRSGDEVLYAGAGTGLEAVAAREAGARVTLLDTSPAMLSQARLRFEARGLPVVAPEVELRQESLESHLRARPYDVVVASFFLNVYAKDALPAALARLASLVRPNGHLVIVDFAPPSPRWTLRAVQQAYYVPPLLLFGALVGNPWHPLYDYARALGETDRFWGVPERRTVHAFGLPLFEATAFRSEVLPSSAGGVG